MSGHCRLTLASTFHRVSLQPSVNGAHSNDVHHSNPLCDDGLSEALVLRRSLLKRHWQISTLAPSGGMHYSQTSWQPHLKVTLVNLPTAGKHWLCWLTVSSSRHFGSEVFLLSFLISVWKKKLCGFPKLLLHWCYEWHYRGNIAVIGLQRRLVTVIHQKLINFYHFSLSKSDK